MSFSDELRHLAERAQTPREQDAIDDRQRSLLVSLFRLLARAEGADVTVKKTSSPICATERIGRYAGEEGQAGSYAIRESGELAVLAYLVDPEVLQAESLRGEEVKALERSLMAPRFAVLTDGHKFRFYTSFGETADSVFSFDLTNYTRRGAKKLRALFRAIVALCSASRGSISTGHGLCYVYAVDNGEPFGKRETTCKLGITGKSPQSRRRFHEWRLGIQGNDQLRLCYLGAGSAVATEKTVRRRTSHMAPPGLGPRSEWRWCSPMQLVEIVKEVACDHQEESDRLGLGLAHVTLADPLFSADPPVPADHQGSADPPPTPEPAVRMGGSSGKGEEKENSGLGDRLSAGTALGRGAEAKRMTIKGNLGERSGENTLTFRISDHATDLLEECAQQSYYRSRSAYVRDQIIGWSRDSIVAKGGLVIHWLNANWGTAVAGEEWEELRGLIQDFFNPNCISGGEKPFPEDPLQKVLRLIWRHLLAVEPQPLQLLGEQLLRMKRFEELKKLTAPSSPNRLWLSVREEGPEWPRKVKRHALEGVSEKEYGYRALENIRMAPAERTAAERNAAESSYANISSYVRNYALGWDRDPLVVAQAAVALGWLSGHVDQPIRGPGWKSLGGTMQNVFDTGLLPGADTAEEALQVAERHLLKAERERAAAETGIV
jgi:hypothetical protein